MHRTRLRVVGDRHDISQGYYSLRGRLAYSIIHSACRPIELSEPTLAMQASGLNDSQDDSLQL